jgi:hypothetical protein
MDALQPAISIAGHDIGLFDVATLILRARIVSAPPPSQSFSLPRTAQSTDQGSLCVRAWCLGRAQALLVDNGAADGPAAAAVQSAGLLEQAVAIQESWVRMS